MLGRNRIIISDQQVQLLRDFRIAKGWSQTQLARAISQIVKYSMSYDVVFHWEVGVTKSMAAKQYAACRELLGERWEVK